MADIKERVRQDQSGGLDMIDQPRPAISVETMAGDVHKSAEVANRIESRLALAKIQKERFSRAKVIIIVTDCPDVRVDFPMSEEIQNMLGEALGLQPSDVAVIPLGAFGGGFDLAQLDQVKAALEAEGKQVLVMQMAHAKTDDGGEGCGALGANEAIEAGTAHLPLTLRKMVQRCIAGIGSNHHRNLFSRLVEKGYEGAVVLNNHARRRFVVEETRATKSQLASRLGGFFSSNSDALGKLESLIGMAPEIDVSHQTAPYGVVEIGGLLSSVGSAPILLDGGNRADWQDAFIVNTLAQSLEEIKLVIASQIYPQIARHHGDFLTMESLVIIAPTETRSLVEQAIAEIKEELVDHNKHSRQSDEHAHEIKFFDNITFVASESILAAVA